ncbi:hypothetical protein TNCT_496851 [Trichonephila clavata]|uniref:Uncharacterized protein n=1 Tax=Trichonephila clavata TaxID=2740835 RepID=A0A8X6JEE6_TRICU|nr:hypothetical protein TNCT_496851 [Trichonephila clavata]
MFSNGDDESFFPTPREFSSSSRSIKNIKEKTSAQLTQGDQQLTMYSIYTRIFVKIQFPESNIQIYHYKILVKNGIVSTVITLAFMNKISR